MNRPILASLIAMSLSLSSSAFANSSFDDLALAPNSFFNPLATTTFVSGDATYLHKYFASFGGYTTDWTYSNKTDTTTAGYANQYSAITGGGQGASGNYGLVNVNSEIGSFVEISLTAPATVTSAYFTNTTYAALSMRDGDGFAKKFGGVSGNDADFFKLTISGFNGAVATGSIDFYLADFRSGDNAQDYIVRDWRLVNLSGLGVVTSLRFGFSSSDNSGPFANTPSYFAIDTLTTAPVPEPGQYVMLLVGLAFLGVMGRKRATS